MSTITREQLITQAQENVAQWRDAMQHNVNTEYAAIRLHLAEIALASLEAEPIYQCEFCHHDGNGELQWHWEDVNKYFYDQYDPERRGKRRIIYTAPPAPVSVPDESAVELLANDLMKRIDKITGERHSVATLSSLRVSIVDACRAAMLQGAAGNSPVIPNGWVMVPVEPTPEMREAYHQAQGEYEDVDGLWSPDHQWQAMLAAAPQQEVK